MTAPLATVTIALGPILSERQLLKLAEIAKKRETTLDAVFVAAVDHYMSREEASEKAEPAALPA